MNAQELEEQLVQLKHRKPFSPFEVELLDGQVIKIGSPSLAINGNGACFITDDDELVDFQFDEVHDLRVRKRKVKR